MYTDEQKRNIVGHLKKAKAQWDNPDIETPGDSMEEYVSNYAQGLQPQEQPKKQSVLDRYVSYFKPRGVE